MNKSIIVTSAVVGVLFCLPPTYAGKLNPIWKSASKAKVVGTYAQRGYKLSLRASNSARRGGSLSSSARPTKNFSHVTRPPAHSQVGTGDKKRFVTDKPTSDPNYAGQRFMSSNISGSKHTVIYDSSGRILTSK